MRTPLQLVDDSIVLFKTHWKMLLGFSVLVLIPTILGTVISVFGSGVQLFSIFEAQELTLNPGAVITIIIGWLIAQLGALFITGGLIDMIYTASTKRTISFSKTVHEGLIALLPIFVVTILISIAVTVGLLFLIIPGIIAFVYLLFAPHAIVIHKKKPIAAIKYSIHLVKHRWWKTFWHFLAPTILITLISILAVTVISLPFEFINGLLDTSIFKIIFNIIYAAVSIAVQLAIVALAAIPTVLLYQDLVAEPVPSVE